MPLAIARGPLWLRAVAVLSALTFGCATVRAPASTIAQEVPVEDGRTAPQLELWIESDKAVAPEEAAAAAAEARAALTSALADRPGPGEDMILVVRAQGVTRTPGRRSDQRAATVGLVVGAVVIVAAVVVAVASGHGGGGGGGGGAVKAAGGVARGGVRPPAPGLAGRVPVVGGVRPVAVGLAATRPSPPGPWATPVPRPPPPGPWAPGHRPPPPGGTIRPRPAILPDREPTWTFYGGFDVNVGPWPYELDPAHPIPMAVDEWAWSESPSAMPPDAMPPEAMPEPVALQVIPLEPPPPLELERRGFFQGDWLLLELLLVDRFSGRPLWRKTIEREVDPRSAPDVRTLVDEALAKGTWTLL